MEEKRDEFEEKKDSLMWSEEDYDAMQRVTGFDDESVLEDQKKGVNLVIFSIVCIICLVIGILIGYNINKGNKQPQIDILPNPDDETKVSAIYNRLNASNELYLYVSNTKGEEFSILDLTNLKYVYRYIGENLYVLLEKDGLNLYNYTFSKNTYHRDLVKTFKDQYDEFYFYNNVIVLKKGNNIKTYDTTGILLKEFTLDADKILSCNLEYVIYEKDSRLNIYHINSELPRKVTDNISFFLYFDDDKLFYSESNKIFQYMIKTEEAKELINISLNSVFSKVGDYYIFNDGKVLYTYDNKVRILKNFEQNINEIAYLDPNNIILILEDYNPTECSMKEKKFNILNISTTYITEKTIKDCLNTQVINELINVK